VSVPLAPRIVDQFAIEGLLIPCGPVAASPLVVLGAASDRDRRPEASKVVTSAAADPNDRGDEEDAGATIGPRRRGYSRRGRGLPAVRDVDACTRQTHGGAAAYAVGGTKRKSGDAPQRGEQEPEVTGFPRASTEEPCQDPFPSPLASR
jgi:hypothetical protein